MDGCISRFAHSHFLYGYGLKGGRVIEFPFAEMWMRFDEYLDLFGNVQGLLLDHLLPQIIEGLAALPRGYGFNILDLQDVNISNDDK